MTKYNLISAAFLTVSLTLPMQASAYNGNDLKMDCRHAEQVINEGTISGELAATEYTYCQAYIVGAWHGILVGSGEDAGFCTPKGGITRGQIVLTITKYLRDHPEQLHFLAADLVGAAMIKGFPC